MEINESTFCYVPFTTLILNANGTVSTCRELGTDHTIGNLNTNTIEEIWNGPQIKSLRNEFLTGKIQTCKQHQKNKQCNKLIDNINMKSDALINSTVPLNQLYRLTPDLNGHCNLKCPMCHINTFPNGQYDKLNLWPTLEENIFPYIKEIDLLSGEPFIQDDTFKLIDKIAMINPGCKWRFTTNAHWQLNDFIKSKLDKINVFYISISVDSIQQIVYKKIRTGNLDIVLNNIKAIINYNNSRPVNQQFMIISNFTIQRENWHELKELFNFSEKHSLTSFAQILYEPTPLSILTLPEKDKEQILKEYIKTLDDKQIIKAHRILRAIINSLSIEKQKKYSSFYKVVTKSFFSKI